MKRHTPIILSLYPYARGIGYVCLDAPQTLLDSGVVTIRPLSNERVLARINKFVEFHRPTVVVIRKLEDLHSRRAKQVQSTIDVITDYAKGLHLPVHQYSRENIREAFEIQGAKTKYEIVQKLVLWFPHLEPKVPKIRKAWMSEAYTMCLFDALALAVTHLHRTK